MNVQPIRLIFALAFLVLLGLTSCTQARIGVRPDDTSAILPGVTTKAQIYDQLGVPVDVFHTSGDFEVLVYTQRIQKGMGVGVTVGFSPFPLLAIGHSQVGTNGWIIVLDQSDVVTSIDAADYSSLAEYKLWPF